MEARGAGRGSPSAGLRLAWENPEPVERPRGARAVLRAVAPLAVPSHPVKLDLAIERHLTGTDGLTREQFLVAFSGQATRVPAPALS